MFEPYLLAENGSSASVRTPYLWHKEQKHSTTETNDNTNQLDDSDDDVQIISWEVTADSKRQTDTVDLSESIFEVKNERSDEFVNDVYFGRNRVHTNSTAMNNNTAHLLSNHTPHTITSGQLQKDNNVVLPNRLPQPFPQISVADFAKEEKVLNMSNNMDNATTLYSMLDDADWVNHVSGVDNFNEDKQQNQCHITNNFINMNNSTINIDSNRTNNDTFAFRNGVARATATSTITASNWDDMFSVMNLPKQSQPHTHFESNIPQPELSTMNPTSQLPDAAASNINAPGQIVPNDKPNVNHQIYNNFAYFGPLPQPCPPVELPRRVPATPTPLTMANQQFGILNRMNNAYNKPQEVLTNIGAQQNPPGPPPLQPATPTPLTMANQQFGILNRMNNAYNKPQEVLTNIGAQQNPPGPPPLQPATPTPLTMANQQFDMLNRMNNAHNKLQEVLTNIDAQQNPPVPPPLQPATPTPLTMANQQFDMLNRMNNAHNKLQEILTNIDAQQNPPGPIELANRMKQLRDNAMRTQHERAGGVPLWHQHQQQANAAPVQFPPYPSNGMQPPQNNMAGHLVNHLNPPIGTNTSMAPPLNIKRKHTVTIPIKVVRSTKQYDTLVEMGFPKKDIEMALRKFDLDLHQAIEYLSESNCTEKRRKKNQNIHNQFIAETPNQIQPMIQQADQGTNNINAEPKKLANLYEELLYLEETGGIVNSVESFDCDICMETIEMKDGIILRNCLHRYCKDCLNGTIVHSDEIDIKCPYIKCEEMLQDREIRAVLSKDEYEKYLMKGVRVAQITISGTILCNLPDCNGWCICDDELNVFICPQCKNTNCIPCKAIHPDRNCREYQDDLAAGDANGIISGERRSSQAIQDLINNNEAMKCPQCGILIMKRDGCDYITCVMCKTGICWATRGPRYGPGGIGDKSGGCGCSLLKKCHETCRGCH